MNDRGHKRPVVFGEVLFDRFPSGETVLGGAPFNVAWNLQALGCEPLFISRVGADALGEKIRSEMARWGMDTRLLQLDPSHATGTVDVRIEDGEPHYDIVASRAYDFIEPELFETIRDAALIYHGSLAMRNPPTRAAFARLAETTGVPRFLDVNLRAPWWKADEVAAMVRGARWVKLNEHELAALGGDAQAGDESVERFRRKFDLEAVVLTRGAEGAVLVTAGDSIRVAPRSSGARVDTVGAGDAFASVVLLGLLEGWPATTTLERAQDFASGVVGLRGATVDDRDFYARYVDAWSP